MKRCLGGGGECGSSSDGLGKGVSKLCPCGLFNCRLASPDHDWPFLGSGIGRKALKKKLGLPNLITIRSCKTAIAPSRPPNLRL